MFIKAISYGPVATISLFLSNISFLYLCAKNFQREHLGEIREAGHPELPVLERVLAGHGQEQEAADLVHLAPAARAEDEDDEAPLLTTTPPREGVLARMRGVAGRVARVLSFFRQVPPAPVELRAPLDIVDETTALLPVRRQGGRTATAIAPFSRVAHRPELEPTLE